MPRSLLFILISLSWSCSDTTVKAFNAEPEAAITSHSDGDEVFEGYTESFRGAVSDPDHAADDLTATWYLDGEVICESAAPEADGITTCEALISSTASEVTLEVQDPENAAGSDQVTLNVVPTDSPEAEITNPTTDGVYYSDQLITFEGVVSDGEDAATDLIVSWESNLDGDLEIDSTPNDDGEVIGYSYLTEGEHAVELDVADTTGKTGTASVIVQVGPPNSAPTCGITAPDDSSAGETGDLVTFLATVADVDVAPDWLTASWSSDKDGEIGTSAPTSAGEVTFPYADLTVNTHVITLSVADEIGATCTDDIVYSVGTAPEISIDSPTSGDVVQEAELVAFVATVSDGEDSPTDLSLSWVSDIDGEFSTQGADSTGAILFNEGGLSTGTHSITATVTDTDGLYANAIVTLQVNGLPSAPEVALTPDPADTTDDLVVTITADSVDPDGDTVSYSYAWSADGVLSSASTSATLSNTETSKGQTWTVEVTPNDGYADGPSGSDDLTIGNLAPEITSVVIDPDPAYPTDELSCGWSFYDEDGDGDESTLEWTIDGTTVGADITLSDVFTAGDVVTCTVTAHDGEESGTSDSDSVTIENTPPEVTEVTLSPSVVFTNDTITASVSTDDAEGDSVSVAYEWYVDGSLVGETGTTLSGESYFDKDQEVYVVVTPNDGTEDGTALSSSSVIVLNTAPGAPSISIDPEDPIEGEDDLVCIIDTGSTDADGDSVTYLFEWEVDGEAYEDAVTTYQTGDTVPAADTFEDEESTCTVTPNDGTDDGDSASASVTMEASDYYNCTEDTYGSSEYWFCLDELVWEDAEAACVTLGAHLVTVDDSVEDSWLQTTSESTLAHISRGTGGTWWIGFNDIDSEGNFVWVDGSTSTYTGWASGEPNNDQYGLPENCTVLKWASSTAGWNDLPCSSSSDSDQEFICER